jgi:aryl-alcohol dehydrogenase-like predicted oxidoreductase
MNAFISVQGALMQYSKLGNTGLIVSRLSFGAMTFGIGAGPFATVSKVEDETARSMVDACLDAGINFFDTANGYSAGQSETMLGRLLGSKRHELIIATKVGFRTGKGMMESGLSRSNIFSACDASLKRLGTDYIDLYIAHREDRFTPIEETVEAFDALVNAGKVRYLGFSNWSAWKAALALQYQRSNGLAEFTSGQMHYALTGRDVEHDIIPFMRHTGLSLTVWSPLAGGFLTGKYTRETLKTDPTTRLSGFDILPFDKEAGFKLVERLREIANSHRASVAQVALAWLLAKPVVASIIIGASKITQLQDNLGALKLQLTETELSALDEMTAPAVQYPNWFSERTVDPVHKEAVKPYM